MAKKECELCGSPARMFCESDQASLCWDCDEKVHAANFLVAKHTRTLLCHACHAPTPWKAAGLKLGPTVSVCRDCAGDRATASIGRREEEEGGGCESQESESDGGEYDSDSEGFSDEEEEEDEDEEEEDGENQVVPWSNTADVEASAAATAEASSSGGDENVSLSSSKRARDNAFESEDEDGCCSTHNLDLNFRESDENLSSSSLSLLRPLKIQRRGDLPELEEAVTGGCGPPLGTAAIVEKLRRFQQTIVREKGEASEMILGLCKLTRD